MSGKAGNKRRILGCAAFMIMPLVILLFSGLIFQRLAMRKDAETYPAPGDLYNVGGRMMHINVQGEGGPTVILEAGMGDSSIIWCMVQEEIARFTRVVSYDRAGFGWSDPGPEPRDSVSISGDLRTLLDKAKVPGPYILVGHSFGAHHSRVFAGRYPEDVAGMIMVDASHEDQFEKLPPEISEEINKQASLLKNMSMLAPFGVLRLIGIAKGELLPEEWRGHHVAVSNKTHVMAQLSAELSALEKDAEQAHKAGRLGNKPLVVLTAGKDTTEGMPPEQAQAIKEIWPKLQKELSLLSDQGQWQVVEDSGHHIHVEKPEVLVETVRAMVDSLREPPPAENLQEHDRQVEEQ